MKSKEENQQETMDNKESKIEKCMEDQKQQDESAEACLLYTSPSPRDRQKSRMPSSA